MDCNEWLVYGVHHAIFISGVLQGVGIAEQGIPWFCDHRGAIQAASKVGFGGRTTHVDIKIECMREYVGNGTIALKSVSTKEQMADILTKRLHKSLVAKFLEKVLSR